MTNIVSFPTTTNVCELNAGSDDSNWCGLQKFINSEMAELENAVSTLQSRIDLLGDIDLDDTRLKRSLKRTNVGNIGLDELLAIWEKITEPEPIRAQIEHENHMLTIYHSKKLKYFTITNLRGNVIHILADNADVARTIAWSNDRIKSKDGGNLRKFDDGSIENLAYGAAIQRALAAGWPGEFDIMGNSAVHKGRKIVFGPA